MPALRVSKLGRTIRHQDGELRIVEDIDLILVPGVAVGVTGPVDAGWKSLLRLIVSLDPVTRGAVAFVDRPGEPPGLARSREEMRQEVVFASALDPLLARNLTEAARSVSRLAASRRRRVRQASAQALYAAAGVEPGKATASMTRSERLRICIALASVLQPAHILLEVEPGLASAEERRSLIELIRRVLATGVGMLIGTQDELLLASVAKSVLILEDGRLLAEGAPAAVLGAAWSQARREGLA